MRAHCAWINCCFFVLMTLLNVAGRKSGKAKSTAPRAREYEFLVPHLKNTTVEQGQDAEFVCRINRIIRLAHTEKPPQLVWIRLDTQTILAIEKQIVQDNPRITVYQQDPFEFTLRIKNAQPEDAGIYACRINSKPFAQMKAALDVLVPPVIMSMDTTESVRTQEGTDIFLKCKATGNPSPTITWTREDGQQIRSRNQERAYAFRGSVLHIPRITRKDMAVYICLAANGVPPSLSQRISVNVEFPPKVWVEPKYLGAWKGGSVDLKCEVEAFPPAAMLWYQDSHALSTDDKFDIQTLTSTNPSYHTKFVLTIKRVDETDYKHEYTCSVDNRNGKKEEKVMLHEVSEPADDADESPNYDGQQMDEDAISSQFSKFNLKRTSNNEAAVIYRLRFLPLSLLLLLFRAAAL